MIKDILRWLSVFSFSFLLFGNALYAEDALSKADSAVANILFDYDGASEFATYVVKEDGFVNITFARNVPEDLYGEILTKLQSHQDIKGVLPDKGGPVCRLYN